LKDVEPFTSLTAVALPLLRANVDTDAIIPSREIKTVGKSGLAAGLFAGWRYRGTDTAEPDPGFMLNQAPYRGARILLAGENFGCGSSREHAVWALREYGFRAIIAPSFAPIFFGNCLRNGVVAGRLGGEEIGALAAAVELDPVAHLVTVDLQRKVVSAEGAGPFDFQIDDRSRAMLLEGLDALEFALRRRPAVETYLAHDRRERPWIYWS
jgi:3-isopropylmalate/(R)-2-methylmalate dehydratase small subunit